MNQRIRELAEQAQQYAEHVTPQGLEWFDTFKEKFAGLIVKECADVFWSEDCNTSDLALEEYNRNSKKIKQHFGLDE